MGGVTAVHVERGPVQSPTVRVFVPWRRALEDQTLAAIPTRYLVSRCVGGSLIGRDGEVGMSAITIDTMMPGKESAAAAALSQAMHTNPNHIAIWKGQGERQLARQKALIELIFRRTPTENMGVATDNGPIVGVLRMARSPACQMSRVESLALLPKLVAIQRGNTARTLNWLSTWAKHDPEELHWHLGPIGVLPERQGQRIGTQLMERYLDRVDTDGIGGYLETDKIENVGYYERFGFETTGTDGVSGVTNWFMWRRPQ